MIILMVLFIIERIKQDIADCNDQWDDIKGMGISHTKRNAIDVM